MISNRPLPSSAHLKLPGPLVYAIPISSYLNLRTLFPGSRLPSWRIVSTIRFQLASSSSTTKICVPPLPRVISFLYYPPFSEQLRDCDLSFFLIMYPVRRQHRISIKCTYDRIAPSKLLHFCCSFSLHVHTKPAFRCLGLTLNWYMRLIIYFCSRVRVLRISLEAKIHRIFKPRQGRQIDGTKLVKIAGGRELRWEEEAHYHQAI